MDQIEDCQIKFGTRVRLEFRGGPDKMCFDRPKIEESHLVQKHFGDL